MIAPETKCTRHAEGKADKPFVSIVVPAYNEAAILQKNLARLCAHLQSLERCYLWEIIVVNDGSTDRTGELAESFAAEHGHVYVLHHLTNMRLGQTLRFAFAHCHGDYVVTMDLDLSYAPDHIELHAFIRGRAAPADQAETVAQADRRDGGVLASRMVKRSKRAKQQTGERPRLLGIRDERAEDLILREEHRTQGLIWVDAGATP